MKNINDVAIDVNEVKNRIEEMTASIMQPIDRGFKGKCPMHDDDKKSLKLIESNNGYKFICKEGCSEQSILKKLGFITDFQKENPKRNFPYEKVDSEIKVVTLNEFLEMNLPKKEMILSPFLTTQGIVLIYAKRGVGKTHLSLGIAYAIAVGGTFLKWKAEKAKQVLFIDGEMTAADIQDRLQRISLAETLSMPSEEFFQIITPDLQEGPLPNLSTSEGRKVIDKLIGTCDVLILDNLSSLFRSSFENEADSWQEIQDWLLTLRRRGKSIVIVHHAGKSGQQRGTSKREDVADTVICLKNPNGYRAEEGTCFEVHFEKTRHFYGPDAEPFTAKMTEGDDGMRCWEVSSTESNGEIEIVAEGIKQGLTIQQVMEKTGFSKSQVETRKRKAKQLGLIN